MNSPLICAENLTFKYPDSKKGIQKLCFTIHSGESVALVGENGSGKSTLLLHLNGILQASEGTITIGELLINDQNLKKIRRKVGMVFQHSDDQLFMPTVYDDVAFGLHALGTKDEELEKKVEEALERVGMLHLKTRPPYKLSTGEKKAVAIATVLAMDPDILVMDEPSANLDPHSRRRLIDLLKSFPQTKIIATHDLDMALDICERTIVLHKGQLSGDGKTNELFRNEELLNKSNLEKPLRWQGK